MILNRNQVDGLLEMSNSFLDYDYISCRIGVAVGITAFFVKFPFSIRLTRTGHPEENYALIEDMRVAYSSVTT